MRYVLRPLVVIAIAVIAMFVIAFDYFDDWREFRSHE